MFSKVYIIGPSYAKSVTNRNRFFLAKQKLEKLNMEVFNPLDSFLNFPGAYEKAVRINLERLLNSNAVYVLKDCRNHSDNYVEVMMAINLNLVIIHEF